MARGPGGRGILQGLVVTPDPTRRPKARTLEDSVGSRVGNSRERLGTPVPLEEALVSRRPSVQRGGAMQLSTRNQLKGKVTDVQLGGIMAEVTVDVGGQTVVAAITRGSAEQLQLGAG